MQWFFIWISGHILHQRLSPNIYFENLPTKDTPFKFNPVHLSMGEIIYPQTLLCTVVNFHTPIEKYKGEHVLSVYQANNLKNPKNLKIP